VRLRFRKEIQEVLRRREAELIKTSRFVTRRPRIAGRYLGLLEAISHQQLYTFNNFPDILVGENACALAHRTETSPQIAMASRWFHALFIVASNRARRPISPDLPRVRLGSEAL
jgi:hypothetical protein